MARKKGMNRKRMWALAAVAASVALIAGIWFLTKSREIKVWVYTDYAFRFNHKDWPNLIATRFQEANRIYQRNDTGVRWKVVDSSQVDPTVNGGTIDARRADMTLHFDRPSDIYVIFSGVQQAGRTGSVSPFTRVALIVDYPQKSEAVNGRLLAHELAHLFGVPQDPSQQAALMDDKPENGTFSPRTVAVIRSMRGYPFDLGIDGLASGSWLKKAIAAVSQDDVAVKGNAMGHAHTVLATALINERKNARALVQYRAAVDADPQNIFTHLNLAEAYSRDGQYDKALQQAREAVRVAPDNALSHRALGSLLGRNHQPEAALKELQIAIRLEPNNPQNEVLLGYEYASMFGHLDDAVSALQEAARVDPNSSLARTGLEKAENFKERLQEALKTQRANVHDHPDDPDAHYRLGKLEAFDGDFKNAIADLQKSAELRPGSAATHTELAELYLDKGDPETAWQEIRKVRALGTEPPASLIARLPPQK
jgi:tetratricopeptide (TPR) repeat protein